MTEQPRQYNTTPNNGSKPKLHLKDLQREAEKYYLEITADPKGGYRVNHKDGVAWASFPKGVFQRCERKFHTLSQVQNLFTFIDNGREYEAQAQEIAENAEQWLRKKGRYSISDEQIRALFEEAIAQIATIKRKKKDELDAHIAARRLEWVTQNNLLTPAQVCEQLGFVHIKQFQVAQELGRILEIHFPPECRNPHYTISIWESGYYTLPSLTTDQFIQINHTALLTRVEAAKFLGVSEKEFDALKKKHKLEPADFKHSRKHGWNYYLYHLSSILSLDSLLDAEEEAKKHKLKGAIGSDMEVVVRLKFCLALHCSHE